MLLGAELFSAALALSRVPAELSSLIAGLDVPPLAILFAILLIYFILGCFMESMAMVLLTLPIFIPLMLALDFGLNPQQVLVWFGILVLVSVEVGMISPPFGLNLFVINAMAKDVPMGETYRGVIGFVRLGRGADRAAGAGTRAVAVAAGAVVTIVGAGRVLAVSWGSGQRPVGLLPPARAGVRLGARRRRADQLGRAGRLRSAAS